MPRRWRALPLLLVLSLLLTGCWPFPSSGGNPSPQGRPQARATPGTSESGDFTPLPSSPDALNIAGDAQDPPSLDPALASDAYSHFIMGQLFSGLVTFDNDLKI